MIKRSYRCLIICFLLATTTNAAYAETTVFKSDAKYHYRIPALTADNSKLPLIFAFSEKRTKASNTACKDSGTVDIVMKKSHDNGKTWSSEYIVAGNRSISQSIDANQAYTNPTVLYNDNKLHVIFNTHLKHKCASGKNVQKNDVFLKGDRQFWYSYSSNQGKTWSTATEIPIPKNLQDRVDMVGPGNGIKTYDGRIIFPASGKNIISNDGGASWAVQRVPHGGSEGTIVQLCDGRLMRNDRPGFSHTKYLINPKKPNRRTYTISDRSGARWSDWQVMEGIIMPVNPWVAASMIKFDCLSNNQTRLAFSTPNHPHSREKMSVFISNNSGENWIKTHQLTKDKSDYSSLAPISSNTIGLLYEHGFGAQKIRYSSLNIN